MEMHVLVHRRLYQITARNLAYGVWDAERRGFVGIREKFGAHFLDMEFHVETGPPFGTADVIRDLQRELPADLGIHMHGDPVCQHCGALVRWLGRETGTGPWIHVDPTFNGDCDTVHPRAVENTALFAWLTAQEQQIAGEHR